MYWFRMVGVLAEANFGEYSAGNSNILPGRISTAVG
jgi:hypothetical protein